MRHALATKPACWTKHFSEMKPAMATWLRGKPRVFLRDGAIDQGRVRYVAERHRPKLDEKGLKKWWKAHRKSCYLKKGADMKEKLIRQVNKTLLGTRCVRACVCQHPPRRRPPTHTRTCDRSKTNMVKVVRN